MDPMTVLIAVATYGPIVVTIASAIAAATPNNKDDKLLNTVRKIVDVLALNFGHAKK